MTQNSLVRIDFSLRREVFFVVIGAIIGAITMVVPITFPYTGLANGSFCNRAKFYEANIESIDLENKQVLITHAVGKERDPIAWRSHVLKYDYLVLALGGETNFFGMAQVAEYAFTMKSIDDAMILRNHVINMLEQADVENKDEQLKRRLITFVVVGGGFSGRWRIKRLCT